MFKNNQEAILNLGGNKFFDKVFEENLSDRKIIINEEISSDIVEKIITQILKFNKEDKGIDIEDRKPIYLYFNSCGGDVLIGLTAIDIIKNSKTPVVGVVIGYAYSMACVMFSACKERIMLPNSTLLIHDGNLSISSSGSKAKDIQKFYDKLDIKIKEIIVENSNITEDEYEENADRELYLLADEAKEKNLCDKIVGIDCDIDDLY